MSFCFRTSKVMLMLVTVRSLDLCSYELETHAIIYIYEAYRYGLYTMFDLSLRRKLEWKFETTAYDEDCTMAAMSR